jgi:hypothetical protein
MASTANAVRLQHGVQVSKEAIMGMRIGSASSVGSSRGAGIANWQQRQQGFKDLFAAVQAGDLSAAQKAYSGVTSGGTVKGNGALAQIGQALNVGDIAGARQATQTLLASRSAHHQHQGGQIPGASPVAASLGTSSGAGSLLNLTA